MPDVEKTSGIKGDGTKATMVLYKILKNLIFRLVSLIFCYLGIVSFKYFKVLIKDFSWTSFNQFEAFLWKQISLQKSFPPTIRTTSL